MRKFVLLPDGRYEEAHPNSVAGMCVPDHEFTPIDPKIVDAIEAGIKEPRDLDRYVLARKGGAVRSHDEAFSVAAYTRAITDHFGDPKWDELKIMSIPWHRIEATERYARTVARDFSVQVRYWRMRLEGESHSMAEMLATRTFPGVKTDAIFNEGKFSGQSTGECDARGTWLRAQAEAAGVSTTGKWYCSGLADFPGDPTAWVDSRGDVLRIAEAKNMTVRGYVEHKAHETDPGEDLAIDDGLIEDEVADILESNPHAAVDAIRDEVYQLRTGAVDPNPLLCQDYTSVEIP